MDKKTIYELKDDSLKITTLILDTLLCDTSRYTLSELSALLQYPIDLIVSIINLSLNQNIFEFYVGTKRITPSNINYLLYESSTEKISVISKASLADKESYDRFNAMLYNYYESLKKNEIAQNIMIINNFASHTPFEDERFLSKMHVILSELKTTECVFQLDFTTFFPFAIYRNRTDRQAYLVSLFHANDDWTLKFFPAEYVHFKNDKVLTISLNKIYDHILRIKALNMLNKIWGPHDILLSEDPISIHAIVHDESCIQKIKHDISNQKATLLKNKDNTYSLTIEILGTASFKSWVLSFGSSIEILTPYELREDFKAAYISILHNYG